MEKKVLMKGNEALAEAAIRCGCRHFFGYPITPQTELAAYMAKQMPKRGGVFLQAESEISAINMVYGAAGSGARVMTSSSSPGISLKQEGISYIAGADLPCVVINIVRGGPGLGGIQPSQSDYFQATKGGGHGDYRLLVYAPSSVQEMADLVEKAFDKADEYRMPAMIMGDGMLGQMMEPVSFKPERDLATLDEKPWATTGTGMKRKKNIINSLYLTPDELEKLNNERQERYEIIKQKEAMVEEYCTEDAELILVAYGTIARIVMSAVNDLRAEGYKVGLIRPITLWPFPSETIAKYAEKAEAFLAVEMSQGQMIEDVQLAVNGKAPVYFYGRNGGMIPDQDAIAEQVKQYLKK